MCVTLRLSSKKLVPASPLQAHFNFKTSSELSLTDEECD
jgi:hypothetical protein